MLPKLREWRRTRYPLAKDDKVLCAWNALMIEALCEMYRASGEKAYLAAAKRAQAFLDANLREGTQLYLSFRAGKRGVRAQLSGYAAEISALLALWGASLEPEYLDLAEDLQEGETHPDPDEILRAVRIPLDEAVALVTSGEIRDGKTVCGLLLAKEILRARTKRDPDKPDGKANSR